MHRCYTCSYCKYDNTVIVYCVSGFCNLCPCDDANYLLSDSYADTADSRTDRVKYGECDWTQSENTGFVSLLYLLLLWIYSV